LYEEMEQQLAKERSEIRAEEERKDKKIQREFEMMIQMKDSQMQVHIHFKLLLYNTRIMMYNVVYKSLSFKFLSSHLKHI
jgi:hypothetical protein